MSAAVNSGQLKSQVIARKKLAEMFYFVVKPIKTEPLCCGCSGLTGEFIDHFVAKPLSNNVVHFDVT